MEYRINLTDDTAEQLGRVLGEPIQELEQEILDKEQTIAEKEQEIEELEAEIEAFPAIESKNITANGTYSEEGKAYSPVVVNVPQTTIVPLSVTQNGTYSEAGKAYSPVTVNVPEGFKTLRNFTVNFTNASNIPFYYATGTIYDNILSKVSVFRYAGAGAVSNFFATKEPQNIRDFVILCEGSCTASVTSGNIRVVNSYQDSGFTVVQFRIDSNYVIPDTPVAIGVVKLELNT